MIEGTVNAVYEAALILTIEGPESQAREIEAVVDTGYNGFLTLPPVLVGELALPFVTSGEATLADGSAVSFDIHMVTVVGMVRPGLSRRTPPRPRHSSVCGCSPATTFMWKWRTADASSSRRAEAVQLDRVTPDGRLGGLGFPIHTKRCATPGRSGSCRPADTSLRGGPIAALGGSERPSIRQQFRLLQHGVHCLLLLVGRVAVPSQDAAHVTAKVGAHALA